MVYITRLRRIAISMPLVEVAAFAILILATAHPV